MTQSYHIAVLPGDGIGVEVTRSGLALLQAVAPLIGRQFALDTLPAGAQHYLDSGSALPEETLKVCEKADAILFGAMGLPHVRGADGTEIIPQLDLRFHFDLYAGVRPIRTFAGLPIPLSNPLATNIDLVLVRESTEGLFYARGRGQMKGEPGANDEAAHDTMRISRMGTERICEFAFKLAQRRAEFKNRKARVTNVDKANVFQSMAFWRSVFESVAAKYSDISNESAYVDAIALNLVMKPWQYDVLVTENMYGDILSDLIAALVGGMGMAPSGDIGDKHALFQPAHGTAPDIAGQGKANPTAMLLSVAMMLEWLADRHSDKALESGARMIERAVENIFAKKLVRPMEFGGNDGTDAITKAAIEALKAVKAVGAA